MTKAERIHEALELIDRWKMNHYETSYGPDCQVYEHNTEVVSVGIAKRALEIALGETIKGM